MGELLETVKPPPFPVHERNKQTGAKQTGAAGRGRGTLRKNAEVSRGGGWLKQTCLMLSREVEPSKTIYLHITTEFTKFLHIHHLI